MTVVTGVVLEGRVEGSERGRVSTADDDIGAWELKGAQACEGSAVWFIPKG